MKTTGYGVLRALLLLVVIVSLAACGTVSTKDYATVAAYTPQKIVSPMPSEPITVSDPYLTVTVQVVKKEGELFKNGACYQIDVQVTSTTADLIEIGGNDASVNGDHVPVKCDLQDLTDLPSGALQTMLADISGDITRKMELGKLWVQATINNRKLSGHASTHGLDWVPTALGGNAVYDGFWFVYKQNGIMREIHIPFSSTTAVATTAPAQ